MGLTVDVDLAEAKKYRCSTIPCAGTDRSICSRTMGWVDGDDHHCRQVEMSASQCRQQPK
jgi:hypothetical protein